MSTPHISIKQFVRHAGDNLLNYRDQVLLYDHVGDLQLFGSPCRVDALTVLICLRGALDCSINLHAVQVAESGVLINFPENIITVNAASGIDAYALIVSTEFIRSLPVDLDQRFRSYLSMKRQPFVPVRLEQLQQLLSYYVLCRQQMLHPNAESGHILVGLVMALLCHLISFGQPAAQPTRQADRKLDLLDRFMSMLAKHHHLHRDVAFYARQLCLSPNYLSGVIKQCSGKTAGQWIDEYVILEACSMLRYSGLSVQQVAYQLNFPTQSAFGKNRPVAAPVQMQRTVPADKSAQKKDSITNRVGKSKRPA